MSDMGGLLLNSEEKDRSDVSEIIGFVKHANKPFVERFQSGYGAGEWVPKDVYLRKVYGDACSSQPRTVLESSMKGQVNDDRLEASSHLSQYSRYTHSAGQNPSLYSGSTLTMGSEEPAEIPHASGLSNTPLTFPLSLFRSNSDAESDHHPSRRYSESSHPISLEEHLEDSSNSALPTRNLHVFQQVYEDANQGLRCFKEFNCKMGPFSNVHSFIEHFEGHLGEDWLNGASFTISNIVCECCAVPHTSKKYKEYLGHVYETYFNDKDHPYPPLSKAFHTEEDVHSA